MPSYKLPFWLIFKETTILLLLLVYRLLLLRYVLVVCHKYGIMRTMGHGGFFTLGQTYRGCGGGS